MNPATVEARTRGDASAGRGSPLDPLYAFVKAHLLVANNICLATGTLVATLDFLAPKRWMAPAIVYSATATLLALMVFAAAAPALFDRLASALGRPPTRSGDPPHARHALFHWALADWSRGGVRLGGRSGPRGVRGRLVLPRAFTDGESVRRGPLLGTLAFTLLVAVLAAWAAMGRA